MKKFNWVSMGAALSLTLGLSLPAAAQMTYNFSNTGNCNFPPATCNVTGTATVARELAISGWSADTGASYVASTISDQNGSGIGLSSPSETAGSPQHAIDNDGKQELILLNFNNNKVVLTGLSTGWAQGDADVAILRWTGAATGPTMTSTANLTGMTTTQLTTAGWSIMASRDLDGTTNTLTSTTYGTLSATTGIAATAANSSSWWIVSSYFGGGSLGAADAMKDYFKLLSVSATCVSATNGSACNTVPEPTSLVLAGLALAGLGYSRRKQKVR